MQNLRHQHLLADQFSQTHQIAVIGCSDGYLLKLGGQLIDCHFANDNTTIYCKSRTPEFMGTDLRLVSYNLPKGREVRIHEAFVTDRCWHHYPLAPNTLLSAETSDVAGFIRIWVTKTTMETDAKHYRLDIISLRPSPIKIGTMATVELYLANQHLPGQVTAVHGCAHDCWFWLLGQGQETVAAKRVFNSHQRYGVMTVLTAPGTIYRYKFAGKSDRCHVRVVEEQEEYDLFADGRCISDHNRKFKLSQSGQDIVFK